MRLDTGWYFFAVDGGTAQERKQSDTRKCGSMQGRIPLPLAVTRPKKTKQSDTKCGSMQCGISLLLTVTRPELRGLYRDSFPGIPVPRPPSPMAVGFPHLLNQRKYEAIRLFVGEGSFGLVVDRVVLRTGPVFGCGSTRALLRRSGLSLG